jgi:acetyl esterase/lipase
MRRLGFAVPTAVAVLTLSAQPAFPAFAPTTTITRDVQYGRAGTVPLRLDIYSRGTAKNRPAIVLLHGGQWVFGDKRQFEPEGRRIAAMGWVAISVNYRLTGALWPGEYDDVRQALRWLVASSESLGVDPHRIVMLGASSGAHLAALVATKGRGIAAPGVKIKAAALWSAPLDLTSRPGDSPRAHLPRAIVERFIGCREADCPDKYRDASPVTHAGASSAPLYIANSTNEVIPAAPARSMAAALARYGIPYRLRLLPGTTHGLTADCSVQPCARGYEELVWDETFAFLRTMLARTTTAAASDASPPAPGSVPAAPPREPAPSPRPALVAILVVAFGLLAGTSRVLVARRRAHRAAI